MKNPMRKGSMGHRVLAALLKARKPISISAISRRTKLRVAQTAQVVYALLNPVHNNVLRRNGLRLVRDEAGAYSVARTKPEPNAKRQRTKARKRKR